MRPLETYPRDIGRLQTRQLRNGEIGRVEVLDFLICNVATGCGNILLYRFLMTY